MTNSGCASPAAHLPAPKSRQRLVICGKEKMKLVLVWAARALPQREKKMNYQSSVWRPWGVCFGRPRRGLGPSSGNKRCFVSLRSGSTACSEKSPREGPAGPIRSGTAVVPRDADPGGGEGGNAGSGTRSRALWADLGVFLHPGSGFFPRAGQGGRQRLHHKRQSAGEPLATQPARPLPCQASTAARPGPEPRGPPLPPLPQPPEDLQEPAWRQQHPKGGPFCSGARLEKHPAR